MIHQKQKRRREKANYKFTKNPFHAKKRPHSNLTRYLISIISKIGCSFGNENRDKPRHDLERQAPKSQTHQLGQHGLDDRNAVDRDPRQHRIYHHKDIYHRVEPNLRVKSGQSIRTRRRLGRSVKRPRDRHQGPHPSRQSTQERSHSWPYRPQTSMQMVRSPILLQVSAETTRVNTREQRSVLSCMWQGVYTQRPPQRSHEMPHGALAWV